jgi:hypothetical protein
MSEQMSKTFMMSKMFMSRHVLHLLSSVACVVATFTGMTFTGGDRPPTVLHLGANRGMAADAASAGWTHFERSHAAPGGNPDRGAHFEHSHAYAAGGNPDRGAQTTGSSSTPQLFTWFVPDAIHHDMEYILDCAKNNVTLPGIVVGHDPSDDLCWTMLGVDPATCTFKEREYFVYRAWSPEVLAKVQDVLEVLPRMNPMVIHPVHGKTFIKTVTTLLSSCDEQKIWYGPFLGWCMQNKYTFTLAGEGDAKYPMPRDCTEQGVFTNKFPWSKHIQDAMDGLTKMAKDMGVWQKSRLEDLGKTVIIQDPESQEDMNKRLIKRHWPSEGLFDFQPMEGLVPFMLSPSLMSQKFHIVNELLPGNYQWFHRGEDDASLFVNLKQEYFIHFWPEEGDKAIIQAYKIPGQVVDNKFEPYLKEKLWSGTSGWDADESKWSLKLMRSHIHVHKVLYMEYKGKNYPMFIELRCSNIPGTRPRQVHLVYCSEVPSVVDKAVWQKVYWKDRFDTDANARHKASKEHKERGERPGSSHDDESY